MKDYLCQAWLWTWGALTSKVMLLSVGGAFGTNCRYWLGSWLDEKAWATGFPLGTFIINVSGSFVLGVAVVVIRDRLPPAYQYWFLLVGTGFCGGYTTFSTFAYETFVLIQNGNLRFAALNVLANVTAALLAVIAAVALTKAVFRST